ncbi:hypothetical protein A3D78_06885 [Candidatus Gottesmanbacteria bacterium RIFCSPHIGHO2_02_FULL_39_14]|uniref:Glycosyltransferase RgtA/B/C/D-like domain-containing protein n=1 Tax=Candidatus Gottesmanbacteria bacterium RIFCSPHIGHO2_02_FULL_39_14 TaxID=1798383 RepID=A0A1F5ZV31_9BACT|nr:MAG: hypothetical protein A3D78_06885 [Candidatus Gottesmanbacteria bacterium RIFCSPHIGHO2_02_FULL_39_14]
MLITSLLFLIFLFFFVYLPSRSFFLHFRVATDRHFLENLGLILVFGIVFLILYSLFIQLIGLPFFFILSLPLLSVYFISRRHFSPFPQALPLLIKENFFILALVIVSSFIQAFPLYYGFRQEASGLRFPSIHDNLWNIAVINNLIKQVPPEHPAVSGTLLRNHHYFYHYFLVLINKFTSINIFDLYFRFGPILVSLLFGLSLLSFASLFTQKKSIRALAVFLGFYSGNLAYLAPFIFKSVRHSQGNLFFADQPFDQIFNPYSVLGFAVFLYSFYSLFFFLRSKKLSSGWLIITSILIGASFGIKSFAGIILISSIILTALVSYIYYRNKKIVLIALTSLFIFLPVFLLISSSGSVSLKFAPGWLLREMMVGTDKLNLPRYADMENYYQSTKNYLGLIKIKSVELFIYLIGNLGVRILGIFFLVKKLIDKTNTSEKVTLLFITFAVVFSLSLPLLFNLSASPFNVIQFTPFSLVVLSVLTALLLDRLKFLLIVIIILLAIPVNVRNFISKFSHSGDFIANSKIAPLDYLKKNSAKGSIILINPSDFALNPIYIPALSGSFVYLADPGYARQTGIDPAAKLKEIDYFFQTDFTDTKFLKERKISYLYLVKSKLQPEVVRKLRLEDNIYQIVMENEEILLLRVI